MLSARLAVAFRSVLALPKAQLWGRVLASYRSELGYTAWARSAQRCKSPACPGAAGTARMCNACMAAPR